MTTVEVKNWTAEYYIRNQLSCQETLENSNILKRIPLLNNVRLQDIRDKQLVKFRGMVQDMYDPEYYFKEYEVKNTTTGESYVKCGMYTDVAHCSPHEEIPLNSNKHKHSERQTCVIISIPALNDWAREQNTNVEQFDIGATHNAAVSSISKRSLGDDGETDCLRSIRKKEKVDNMDVNMSEAHCNTKIQSVISEKHLLNFPIPIEDGKACLIKIYDETVLNLNQMIDVIGFISLDPTLSTIRSWEDEMNEAEVNTHNPPVSLMPRLHAIKIINLAKHEIENAPEIISKARIIRDNLHLILTQLLFGDNLAADYLICHLLSTVYMRNNYLCLGAFPLNITNFPISELRTFPKDFYNFLTLLVKKSYFLDLTLENLNKLTLIPKKDYECNRLTSGILQLSDYTHLVIDETGLTAGELTLIGKENYKTLSDLLMFQKLTYDFKYYKMEFNTDMPMLILSDVKSFIFCPLQVILNVDAETEKMYSQVLEVTHQYLKNENQLANIRQYFEVLKNTEFNFNNEMTKTIEEDFVQLRSTNKNVGADDLHRLMVFARLMALSYGKTTLDIECWKKVLNLEMERMIRLPQRK